MTNLIKDRSGPASVLLVLAVVQLFTTRDCSALPKPLKPLTIQSGRTTPNESGRNTPNTGSPRSRYAIASPHRSGRGIALRCPTPTFGRRASSAPVMELCMVGFPLPPSESQVQANHRHEDLFSNLMYQWTFDNPEMIQGVRMMVDQNQSVKMDVICALTYRSLAVPDAEVNHYDINFRVNMLRNTLSEIMDHDPRQFKFGKAEIVIVETRAEETCALKISPYRLRTIHEALDDM